MDYGDRLQFITKKLVEKIKSIVQSNQNNMFQMWLECDADTEFGNAYINIVKQHSFSDLTQDDMNSLYFAGKNAVFFIQAITKNNQIQLTKLLKNVEAFVTFQMDDFHNWCENVVLEVPDEDDNPN